MSHIPGGIFHFGEDSGPGFSIAGEAVAVMPFDMDTAPVSVAEYRHCVVAGVCSTPAPSTEPAEQAPPWDAWWQRLCNYGTGRDDHPINCIDLSAAATYCRWAGKRLPTEIEWEYATRGGDGRRYPWGNESPSVERACFFRDDIHAGQPTAGTCPILTHPAGASPFGVQDVAGNVSTWTSTVMCRAGQNGCRQDRYATRGGDFFSDLNWIESAYRGSEPPEVRSSTLGVRCARDAR